MLSSSSRRLASSALPLQQIPPLLRRIVASSASGSVHVASAALLVQPARYCTTSAAAAAPVTKVKVTFVDGRSKKTTVCDAPLGKTVLNVGLDNNQEIEAACDGTCACSTCHVYVDEEHFARLPKASDDEEDMLDLAIERKSNSRLCCQINVSKECDGMVLTLPAEVSNQMS